MTSQLQRRSTESLHYVVLAGNGGRPIFIDDEDRDEFTRLVVRFSGRCDARIHAYCWTPSVVRMLLEVRPSRLPSLMARIGGQHATHINERRCSKGDRVFHGRYSSIGIVEDEDVLSVVLRIHRTPVDLGLVDDLADYRWSSHPAYLAQARMPWVITSLVTDILRRKYPAVGAYDFWMGDARHLIDTKAGANRAGSVAGSIGDAPFIGLLLHRAQLRRVRFSIEEVTVAVLRWLQVDFLDLRAEAKDSVMRLARTLVAHHVKNNKIATLEAAAERLHRSPSALSEGIVHFRKLYPILFDMPLEKLLHGHGSLHRIGCVPQEPAASKTVAREAPGSNA